MARIELSKTYPFTTWDAAKKEGGTDKNVFVTIEYETAKSKAGFLPFVVTKTWGADERFTMIDDAVEHKNKIVRRMAMQAGWTPEQEG